MFQVDPVRDFLRTRGTIRGVLRECSLLAYKTGEVDSWASPVKIRGNKDAERTEQHGDVVATKATWTITNLTADVTPLERPLLKSQIVSEKRKWRIDAITASPMEARIFVCECTLVE